MVATMYIDTSHITRGGKTYTRHLLRESYRANGKVVVSLSLADNVSRPLPCLLQGVHQPVIRSRNSFSRPRSACLACI